MLPDLSTVEEGSQQSKDAHAKVATNQLADDGEKGGQAKTVKRRGNKGRNKENEEELGSSSYTQRLRSKNCASMSTKDVNSTELMNKSIVDTQLVARKTTDHLAEPGLRATNIKKNVVKKKVEKNSPVETSSMGNAKCIQTKSNIAGVAPSNLSLGIQ